MDIKTRGRKQARVVETPKPGAKRSFESVAIQREVGASRDGNGRDRCGSDCLAAIIVLFVMNQNQRDAMDANTDKQRAETTIVHNRQANDNCAARRLFHGNGGCSAGSSNASSVRTSSLQAAATKSSRRFDALTLGITPRLSGKDVMGTSRRRP